MNNKKQISSEQGVLSRRLRPIYDAIDSGQHKKAIQEADKVLKKHPNTPTAKALKALGLIRTEKLSQARPLMAEVDEEILQAKALDENSVQALCHCYKESFEPERIIALYESLNKLHKNEQLLSNLFLAYARVRDFKQQQKVAMQLYKEFNNITYYLWATMSVYMQGSSDEKLGTSMFYPLADKMMEKVVTSKDPGFQLNEPGFELYLMILEARRKFSEAINFLERDPGLSSGAISGTAMKHRLDTLYKAAGEHNAVVARAICSLETQHDDWENWKNLVASALVLIEQDPDEESRKKMVHRMVEICKRSFQLCEEREVEPIFRRGPFMARLMLMRLSQTNKSICEGTVFGTPLDALKEMVAVFHSKPFCFADIRCFLHLLTDDASQNAFLAHIAKFAAESDTGSSTQQESSNAHCFPGLLLEQCRWHFAVHNNSVKTPEQLTETAVRLLDNLPRDRDQGGLCASYFAQLIAHHFWELYNQTGDWRVLFALIVLMEFVRDKYPSSTFVLPLILTRLYALLGDSQRVREICKQMQIKYVQRDSLGYIQTFLPEKFGRFKSAVLYYTSLGAMYDQNEREVSECIVNAYKNAAFQQIPKMSDFSRRLSNSLFAIGSDIMNRWYSACFAVDSLDLAAMTLIGDNDALFDWDLISDNRDFNTISTFLLPEQVTVIQKESFNEIKAVLKLRHTLCRAIGFISQLSAGRTELTSVIGEFFDHLEFCKNNFAEPSNLEKNFESFINLRLSDLLAEKLLGLPIFFLKMALDLSGGKSAVSEQNNNNASSPGRSWDAILEKLPAVDELDKLMQAFELPASVAPRQENIFEAANLLSCCAKHMELLALSLIACKFLENAVAKTQMPGKTGAKSKKEKPYAPITERFANYQLIFSRRFKEIRIRLNGLLVRYADQEVLPDLAPFKTFFEATELIKRRVIGSVEATHAESVQELLAAITHVEKSLVDPAAVAKLEDLSLATS